MKHKVGNVIWFTTKQVLTAKWYWLIGILGIICITATTQIDKFIAWLNGVDGTEAVDAATTASDLNYMVPFLAVMILFLLIMIYGAGIGSSIVEEKSARIVETLFCYVKPIDLLTGKILGYVIGVVLQLSVFVVYDLLLTKVFHLASNELSQMLSFIGVPTVVFVLGALVLGFIMYAFAFAAGASFADNAQDSAQLTLPVVAVLLCVYFLCLVVLKGVDGPVITIISYLPLCSPIMCLATNDLTNITWNVILVQLGIQAVEVVLCAVICSKIYKRGVVSYGIKRNKFSFGKKANSSCSGGAQ